MKTKEEIKDIVWELDNCPKKAQRIKIIENLLKEETEELKAEIKEFRKPIITKPQIKAIEGMIEDIGSMIGCAEIDENGNSWDKSMSKRIKLINRFLTTIKNQ